MASINDIASLPTMQLKNIGHLQGRLVVFGGVYSNLHALKAMHQVVEDLGVSPANVICTGDIAGYCAYPDACLNFLADWGVHAITGNVEENIRDGQGDCGCGFGEDSRCDIFARMWYPYAQQNTGAAARDYIKKLPQQLSFTYAGLRGRVLHGSVSNTSEFIWQSTPWEQKAVIFAEAKAELILAGHCGLPFAHTQDGKSWLNAGVIGMPANDGTQSVWYMVLDDAGGQLSYRFHRLAYDHEAARQAMLAKPLPKSYALTLKNGIWDNTEIMPTVEAAREGIPLDTATIHTTDDVVAKTAVTENMASMKSEKNTKKPAKKASMDNKYYDPKDLKRFGQINEYQEEMGKQFFDWYENVTHGDTALTQREKALIALAVSHAIQCPYCIDAYTTGSLESGADEEQMMEAVHVAAAIKAGTTLIYSLQMKKQIEKLTM